MDFLSNASYSGYRNHIQKDILQENVKFGQCDWTWHVDLLSGWRNKEPAWDLIGQDNHWEVPKRPSLNTQDTPLNTLLNPLSELLLAFLNAPSSWTSLSLSPENALSWECHLLTLSSALDHTQPVATMMRRKTTESLYILLFFDFSLFSFRWVRVLSCVCQRRQAQDSAKPANAHFNDSWTLSQSATSEKPFPAKTEDKGKSLNTKLQVQTPEFAVTGVILKIDFSLIEKSMRVLNLWLMIVQVYAIAHIAVNVGYQILILLI